MAPRSKPGLWVMEGKWSSRVSDFRSVDPVLRALGDAGVARHTRFAINDGDDFLQALTRWGQAQHDRYGIGYVAMHGGPGKVYPSRKQVNLMSLGSQLPPRALAGKVLHFGSCSVLEEPESRRPLLEAFGVRAITGFTKEVGWFESLAFELLLFECLAYYKRLHAAEAYMRKHYPELADMLGFVMVRR